MRVAIVGGHGQIARLLHPLLVAAGHQPVALVRSEGHRPGLEAFGAEVRLLDIEREDATAFARAFEGCRASCSQRAVGLTATSSESGPSISRDR